MQGGEGVIDSAFKITVLGTLRQNIIHTAKSIQIMTLQNNLLEVRIPCQAFYLPHPAQDM